MAEEQVNETHSERRVEQSEIKELGDKIVALSLMQAKELADYLKDEFTGSNRRRWRRNDGRDRHRPVERGRGRREDLL